VSAGLRRLEKVEEALTPTEIVVRWLAEAHAYDDLVAYTQGLILNDPPTSPMDRLAHEAEENARRLAKGRPRPEAETFVRRSIVETLFRGHLVLRINVVTHEVLDREQLLHAGLSAYLALALTSTEHGEKPRLLSIDRIRDLLFLRVDELLAYQEARVTTERRYLAGATALFPAVARAWDAQVHEMQTLAITADRLAELDGLPGAQDPDPDAATKRIAQLSADLVEPARSRAYEQAGNGRRAFDVATAWLRPKVIGS
jgi:hypothetical protein